MIIRLKDAPSDGEKKGGRDWDSEVDGMSEQLGAPLRQH